MKGREENASSETRMLISTLKDLTWKDDAKILTAHILKKSNRINAS